MAATRLETDTVRRILMDILNDLDYWEEPDKAAEKTLTYIAGATDMANAVIKAIKELGGK